MYGEHNFSLELYGEIWYTLNVMHKCMVKGNDDILLRFTKMHSTGNDYIYIDCMSWFPEDPAGLSVRLSDRRFGVGGDGIILICPSETADFRMRMFNADSSEGLMCGNGARAFARFVREKGLTDKDVITIETLSGVKTAEILGENVRVDMGRPSFAVGDIPAVWPGEEIVGERLTVGGRDYIINCLSMGNPHCVIFTDEDVDDIDLAAIGPLFDHHAIFPERVNTEFVNIMTDGSLRMRVWERGSGETLACGTGACAVGVAAMRTGVVTGEAVTVHLRGGDLLIEWRGRENVLMTGPAVFVFEGETNI